jgi:HD-GYP domain-containing protein (c-di-GMP phosphodiesterase class II)
MALPLSLSTAPPRPSGIVPDHTEPDEFCAIDLDGLVDDTALDFNLYLPAGPDRFVFYRSISQEFTPRHRQRLLDNNVRTVYIRTAERQQYLKYLEHNLDRVLSNPAVGETKKAKLLYSVSQTVMQETLEQPRSQEIVPRTRQMAQHTVDFVLKSDQALGQLARLMTTDYYTYTHSINVCVFGVALAREAGVSAADLKEFAVGSLLHDLGKTQIEKDLITRAGSLTDDEMEVVRRHVIIGEQLLTEHHSISTLAMIAVSQHHEKLDGSGYPRKLTASQIPVQSKIMTISDIYDALVAIDRPYKGAQPPDKALDILRDDVRRGRLDGDLLDVFIEAKIYDLREFKDLIRSRK